MKKIAITVLPLLIIFINSVYGCDNSSENFNQNDKHVTEMTADKVKSIIHYGKDDKGNYIYVVVIINRTSSPFGFSLITTNEKKITQVSWMDLKDTERDKLLSLRDKFVLVNGDNIEVQSLDLGKNFSIDGLEKKIEMGVIDISDLIE